MTKSMKIKGIKPLLFISSDEVLAYRHGQIMVVNRKKVEIIKKSDIPSGVLNKLAAHFRLFERVLRLSPRTIEAVDEHIFLFGYKGSMYHYDKRNNTVEWECAFPTGMSSPLNIQRIEGNTSIKDGVYFGQYTENLRKESVKIWKRNLTKPDWEVVYEFPQNTIHHIHNIIPNKDNSFVYILTGDDDSGSGIWKAYDDFSHVEPLLIGSQDYRTCELFEIKDQVVFCTDTPMRQNYIYGCSLIDNSLQIERRYEIPGSVIYGTANRNEIVISTTVEPNSIFDKSSLFQKYFERKIGDGIKDEYVHVIKGNFENGFIEIYSEEKDLLPMRLCQFGSIQFPRYSFSLYGIISLYCEATRKDNTWITMEE